MKSNWLKLNSNKTQFLWLGSRQQLAKIDTKTLTIGEHCIESSTSDKNLGVTFDSELGMDLHVNNITRSCFYQLRQMRFIRRSLSTDAAKTLVRSLISSRVDYCNSIVTVPQILSWEDCNLSSMRLPGWSRPYHSCVEGPTPLASHSQADRVQDRGLRPQRHPRTRSDIPQLHLQSCSGGRRQDSPAVCCAGRPDRLCLEPRPVASGLEVSVSPDRLFGTHCLRTSEFRNCRCPLERFKSMLKTHLFRQAYA